MVSSYFNVPSSSKIDTSYFKSPVSKPVSSLPQSTVSSGSSKPQSVVPVTRTSSKSSSRSSGSSGSTSPQLSGGTYDVTTQTYTDSKGNKYSVPKEKVPSNATIIKSGSEPVIVPDPTPKPKVIVEDVYENVFDTKAYESYVVSKGSEFEAESKKVLEVKKKQLASLQNTERKRTLVKEKVIASTGSGGSSDVVGQGLAKKRTSSYELRQKKLTEKVNKELEEDFESRKREYVKDVEGAKSRFVRREKVGTKTRVVEYVPVKVSKESEVAGYFIGKGVTIYEAPKEEEVQVSSTKKLSKYDLLGEIPKSKDTNLAYIGEYKDLTDISKEEFDAGVKNVVSESKSIPELIVDKFVKRYSGLGEKWRPVVGSGFKEVKAITKGEPKATFGLTALSFSKDLLSTGYETVSDVAGGVLSAGSKTVLLNESTARLNEYSLESQNLLKPRATALKEFNDSYSKDVASDLYLGKQVAETASYFTPYSFISSYSAVGQVSRAETVGEVVVPLALGGGFRLISPSVGKGLSGVINKTNVGLEGVLNKYLGSKLPVLEGVIATSKFSNLLSSEKVAKGLMYAGGLAEVGGMVLTPLEEKQDYLKQVGLVNALSPVGYRLTDAGIAVGKYGVVKALAPLKGYEVFSTKELMDDVTYNKFVETGGGTPIFRGTEQELIGSLQGVGESQRVGVVAERFGFDLQEAGIGAGFRSVGVKLPDVVEPRIGNYEALTDFYSSSTHPISLSGVGLKNRLFKPLTSPYDRVSIEVTSPSIEFTLAPRGTAISFVGKEFTPSSYSDLKSIYGYNIVDYSLDVPAKVGKIPMSLGQTFSDLEYQKILMGGRPFKTRDVKSLIGDTAFESYFVNKGDFATNDLSGFYSSQSRSIGATSEKEFLLGSARKRLELKGGLEFSFLGKSYDTKSIFRKLGFADAYVDVGFEVVPMNIEGVVPKSSVLPVVKDSGKQFLLDSKKEFVSSKTNVVDLAGGSVDSSKPVLVARNGVGGYSEELSEVFGKRNLERVSLPLVVNKNGELVEEKPVYSLKKSVDDSFYKLPSMKKTVLGYSRIDSRISKSNIYYDLSRRSGGGYVPLRIPFRSVDRIPSEVPDIIRIPPKVPDRIVPKTPERTFLRTPEPPRVPPRYPEIRMPPYVPPRRYNKNLPSIKLDKGSIKRFGKELKVNKTRPVFQLKADFFRRFVSAEKDIPFTKENVLLRKKLWSRLGSARAFIPTKELLTRGYINKIGLGSGRGLVL